MVTTAGYNSSVAPFERIESGFMSLLDLNWQRKLPHRVAGVMPAG